MFAVHPAANRADLRSGLIGAAEQYQRAERRVLGLVPGLGSDSRHAPVGAPFLRTVPAYLPIFRYSGSAAIWLVVFTGHSLYHRSHPDTWPCSAQTRRVENSEAFADQHAADSTSFYIFDEAGQQLDNHLLRGKGVLRQAPAALVIRIQIVTARQPERYDTSKPLPLPFSLRQILTKKQIVKGNN